MYILTLEQIKALPTVPERVTELAIENEKLKNHVGELAATNATLNEALSEVSRALSPLVFELYEQELGVVDLNEVVVTVLRKLGELKAMPKNTDAEIRKKYYNLVTSLMLLLHVPHTEDMTKPIFEEVKALKDKVQVFEQIQALTKGIYASQNAQAARV